MGVKKVDGWDDPCFPTVQGIVRRGLKVEALILFILEQFEERKDFLDVLNTCTKIEIPAVGDSNMQESEMCRGFAAREEGLLSM
ncbi:hypothetical protein Patl1_15321 [Pistacia atlantica]|uniref:Uncharacterized protein n=1 Tax=Pistacia atlantica TaxID=434234 RepID=A0ACC1B7S7_9ROSI|nr:hypothetical protein Patl1_15321 [Pistacia atlantica]